MQRSYLLLFMLLIGLAACSPKIVPEKEVVTSDTNVLNPDTSGTLSPCGKFSDTPDQEQALNAHVIYRDFLKQNNFKEAFPYWEIAYNLAPAADGKRNTHYADGIRFYEHFYDTESDPEKKAAYVDRIFKFYDEIAECYGDDGYATGRKAFDLYYKFKDRSSQDEIYDLFVQSMAQDGEDAQFFILNPFTDLLVRRYQAQEISVTEAQKYDQLIRERLQKGLDSGENTEQWQIINDYIPKRLEAFEGVKDFYACEYYVEKYMSEFIGDSTNCETIDLVYGKLRWGGCLVEDQNVVMIDDARKRHCVVEAPPSDARIAYDALREGQYEDAIENFKKAAAETDSDDKKATYLLLVSKIYYAHLKDFPLSRKFALEAAEIKTDWGEPYLLIGRLYASSGPLCGPGRGWDSQIVVWPAIDKWNYAKKIDPASASEANKWINTYSQYMPNTEDVFQRNLEKGTSFRVECWIQENTIIRTVK